VLKMDNGKGAVKRSWPIDAIGFLCHFSFSSVSQVIDKPLYI
jgi:hypothetical protein